MNIRKTEDRIFRSFERLMEALMILAILLTPVFALGSLGGFPLISFS
jgi:hypothetical protein